MRRVELPGTPFTVSRLCMGTLNFGAGLPQEQCFAHLDRFLECGGNFIDTAHVYSDWLGGERSRSERILGRWLSARDRDSVVLATKGGHFDFAHPEVSRVTPEEIRRDLEESLALLQTDHIDLYFLHRDNLALPVGEIMSVLAELVAEGKIRSIGCSNWTLQRMAEANEYARANNLPAFTVNQLMWSLAKINRSGIPDDYVVMDQDTYAYHAAQRMSAMCFSSQAKGYFPRRMNGEAFGKDMLSVYGNAENDALYERIANGRDASQLAKLCLRYFETHPFPAIPIVSCDTREQLEDCVAAFQGDDPIDQSIYQRTNGGTLYGF